MTRASQGADGCHPFVPGRLVASRASAMSTVGRTDDSRLIQPLYS